MTPRGPKVIEGLLLSAQPDAYGFVAVPVEPAELADVALTALRPGVHVSVVTPRVLREDDVAMEAVDISRSGEDLVIDLTRYRERDEWELSIAPETYERLLEHVVTTLEEGAGRGAPLIDERVRYYKPSLSPTDVQLTIGVLLDAAEVPNLFVAYTIGLKVAAQVHAATLALALTAEGVRVIRDARADPAIAPTDYLRLGPDELLRRKEMFEAAIAKEPRALHGVFEAGVVTLEITRVAADRYRIQVMSVSARAGKITTAKPVLVKDIAAWCERVGAPIDAFEWKADS